MQARLGGLWRHPDFLKLWTGQTISKFGSGITGSALPLTAVLVLGAGSVEMGLLMAASAAPVVLLGLFAGVWVDRRRRRPVMVWADVGRALLLASIPVTAVLGQLRLEHLFVVAAAVGVLTVFFDVAYQSYVPDLVKRERVLEANSRLATSDALAEITTPGLAGMLVVLITAPMALLLDALSFVLSALSIGLIRTPERAAAPAIGRPHLGREIGEGLRIVASNPLLRSFAGHAATRTFFGSFIGALYALYALRELGLGPVLLGIAIGVGGASNLVGTLVVGPVTRRFGVGATMLGAAAVGSLTVFLIPLASGPVAVAFALLVAGQAFDAIHPLYDVNALSVRQSVTPDSLLGRVNASMQVLEGGIAPLGAIAGGVLGELIGVRATLFVAATGILASSLWLFLSPLDRLRELPQPAVAPAAAA
ncbi:MAG: MFS transporter [Chloroflexi bacterium]|nr:MFS transporter [Chloroflexota bacterium]